MSQDQSQNRQEIGVAISQLNSADEHVEKIQQTLINEMAALMGGWQGNAANAFNKAHQAFNEKFELTQRELKGIAERLQSSLGDYTANETTQLEASNSIMNALNF